MRHLIAFLFLVLAAQSFGQKFPFYKHYDWDKNPQPIDLNLSDPLYYYTKYLLTVEYAWDDYYGQYYKYKTEHYRVRLSTDAAIEEFNKVYISMEDVVSRKELKARVIKKDKVVDLKPKIEEFFSESEKEQYFYFPISGLELGDELEIIYTLKMESEFNGDQFFFQGEIPIYDFDFKFIAPNDSYFQFLAHNGLSEPELLDTVLQRNMWIIHMDSIPAFRSEYFCEYNNVTMKLDASLRGFNSPKDKSFSPYDDFKLSLNFVYNKVYDGKDKKSLRAISDEIGVRAVHSQEKNIRIIENYVKMEIALNSALPIDIPVNEIIETERSSTIGAIILFMALFQENGIEYEYGFVSDRYDTHFSDEIESLYFLQSYFFYFPEINKYLAPLDFSSRLGYLDRNWIPNNGLYLTSKQYPYPTTKGKVKPIPSTTARDNVDSTIIRINVNDAMDDLEMTVEVHSMGYGAGKHQCYYYIYSEDRRKEVHEELLNYLNDNSKFKMTTIEGIDPEDAFVRPIVIHGELTELYTPLLEKAGNMTIFKLGHIFGEYVDPREIEKKKTDFVFGNPFTTSTTVIITFPEGVKISNTDKILQSDNFSSHEDILVSTKVEINDNVVVVYRRDEWRTTRYSIDQMDTMLEVFRYYNELSKMNLIIER